MGFREVTIFVSLEQYFMKFLFQNSENSADDTSSPLMSQFLTDFQQNTNLLVKFSPCIGCKQNRFITFREIVSSDLKN